MSNLLTTVQELQMVDAMVQLEWPKTLAEDVFYQARDVKMHF